MSGLSDCVESETSRFFSDYKFRFFQEQVRKSKQVQKSEVLCMCLEKQIEIEKGFWLLRKGNNLMKKFWLETNYTFEELKNFK